MRLSQGSGDSVTRLGRGSGNGIARLSWGSGDSVVRLENFSQCNGGSLLNDIGDSFEDMELRSRLGE